MESAPCTWMCTTHIYMYIFIHILNGKAKINYAKLLSTFIDAVHIYVYCITDCHTLLAHHMDWPTKFTYHWIVLFCAMDYFPIFSFAFGSFCLLLVLFFENDVSDDMLDGSIHDACMTNDKILILCCFVCNMHACMHYSIHCSRIVISVCFFFPFQRVDGLSIERQQLHQSTIEFRTFSFHSLNSM